MIFADASALIGVITEEPEAEGLLSRLKADPRRLSSAMSVWEIVSGLCRSYGMSMPDARMLTYDFLDSMGFTLVTIGAAEADLALEAYQRFGRGRHPAALNMGDCFSYACAKGNRAVLLYKGHDFAKTDMA